MAAALLHTSEDAQRIAGLSALQTECGVHLILPTLTARIWIVPARLFWMHLGAGCARPRMWHGQDRQQSCCLLARQWTFP